MVVRYVGQERILAKYANSALLGHETHMDMFENFTIALNTMFEGKQIQIFIDEPYVSLNFITM